MKAVTVGSAMVDIITIVADTDIERMTMHNATSSFLLLEQGRKIDAESITLHIGGGAVNAAVSMARLGLEVGVLTKIGKDLNAERILERLKAEGVARHLVFVSERERSGTSVMVSSHDRNATIFTQRGANGFLNIDDVPRDAFRGAGLVYISSLSNQSADCYPELVRRGAAENALVAANPGIRQLTTRLDAFFESLQHVSLLALNRVEAAALAPGLFARADNLHARGPNRSRKTKKDLPPLLRDGLSFGGFRISLPTLLNALAAFGLKYVVLTDGTGGSYLYDGAAIFHCPILRVEPQGTAGAGDAFASTLSACLSKGKNPEFALRAAAVNASSVVKHVDTQSGLLKRRTLETRVKKVGDQLPVNIYPIQ
ncbi:MAG: carbohydrate kinase family protein [Methyloligellaceae bacterium]